MSHSNRTIEALNGRVFSTFPAAVVVPIVDDRGRILLLSTPGRNDRWEVVNGGVEAGESLLEAALREAREEAGSDVEVRPLGCVHAETFAYDAHVSRMISAVFVMAYVGGPVVPGDDMASSQYQWLTPAEIAQQEINLLAPMDQTWLVVRVQQVAKLWWDENHRLQGPLSG